MAQPTHDDVLGKVIHEVDGDVIFAGLFGKNRHAGWPRRCDPLQEAIIKRNEAVDPTLHVANQHQSAPRFCGTAAACWRSSAIPSASASAVERSQKRICIGLMR